eukprot:4170650-Alexandrium_andersonii.AAC.1
MGRPRRAGCPALAREAFAGLPRANRQGLRGLRSEFARFRDFGPPRAPSFVGGFPSGTSGTSFEAVPGP